MSASALSSRGSLEAHATPSSTTWTRGRQVDEADLAAKYGEQVSAV